MADRKIIQKEDIEYLVFEGGGGAGNAFPGALEALETLNILEYDEDSKKLAGKIKGVAGSSAGAITALFIAMGFTPTEMQNILASKDFFDFFDTPRQGLVPRIGGCRHIDPEPRFFERAFNLFLRSPLGKYMQDFYFLQLMALYQVASLQQFLIDKGGELIGLFLTFIIGFIFNLGDKTKVLRPILTNLSNGQVQRSIAYDFGIFPGCEFRDFIAKWIKKGAQRVLGLPSTATDFTDNSNGRTLLTEINFQQFYEIFGVDLVATGSNLETSKSHFFSRYKTPNMIVADAIRISMSLPMVFKPVLIKEASDLAYITGSMSNLRDHYLKGVWVDGGYLNNVPISAFDAIAGSQEKTFGIRLRRDERTEIDSIFDFLKVWPVGLGIFGAGESHVSESKEFIERTIELTVSDSEMGLLDFKVDPTTMAVVNGRTRAEVLVFFANAAAINANCAANSGSSSDDDE